VSELLHYHLDSLTKDACLVVVSQSGESAEIVHLLDEIRGLIPVIGVYNNENSTLAKGSSVGLPIYAGPQLACGSKTNVNTLAVMNLLAEVVLGHDLKKAGDQILRARDAIQQVFNNWEQNFVPTVDFLEGSIYTVFVGRGPGRASAMFSACLFREVPKVVAEGMGAAAFRHGLREMIQPEHRVVIFAPSGETTPYMVRLAEDMLKLHIPVLVFTNQDLPLNPSRQCQVVRIDSVDEVYAPIVDIVPPQLVGYLLALKRGLEPGKLVISTYITTVE
jgi:glucosamine--fructose-6-phosphate aminotransferase (isomerizing)